MKKKENFTHILKVSNGVDLVRIEGEGRFALKLDPRLVGGDHIRYGLLDGASWEDGKYCYVDPPGGPFMSVGSTILGRTIKKIQTEMCELTGQVETVFYLDPLITTIYIVVSKGVEDCHYFIERPEPDAFSYKEDAKKYARDLDEQRFSELIKTAPFELTIEELGQWNYVVNEFLGQDEKILSLLSKMTKKEWTPENLKNYREWIDKIEEDTIWYPCEVRAINLITP